MAESSSSSGDDDLDSETECIPKFDESSKYAIPIQSLDKPIHREVQQHFIKMQDRQGKYIEHAFGVL